MHPGRYAKCSFTISLVLLLHSAHPGTKADFCTYDGDCPTKEICIKKRCIDSVFSLCRACGSGADCRIVEKTPVCFCPTFTTGNPYVSCVSEGTKVDSCSNNEDCPTNEACFTKKCVDPCHKGEIGQTLCPPGIGKGMCSHDSDCPFEEACMNRKCGDPCYFGRCGFNAECRVRSHEAICSCPPDLDGDPYSHCLPRAAVAHPGTKAYSCTDDGDCPTKEICINERCIDLCQGACGSGADCRIVNTFPICSCPTFTTGNPYLSCLSEGKRICSHDSDCPFDETCTNGKCGDPCYFGRCGFNAECRVRNHEAICSCPPDLDGDPYSHCLPRAAVGKQMCSHDSDCPFDETCTNGKCEDPCYFGRCGLNAECRVRNHEAICSCPPDFGGDPSIHCLPRATVGKLLCSHDSNCSFEEACINGECVDPCSGRCGLNAECRVRNHEAICSCPPDLGGDPSINCLPPAALVTKKGDPSRTEVTVKDEEGRWITKKFYSGDVIFEDDFSKGPNIDDSKWSHEVRMPSNNGYGFVTYHDSPRNSYVKDNSLFIKPTVLDNETVRHGTRSLENCTGHYNSRECERVARSYDILPPIDAALLTTKNTMHFKYGIVTIRAKLPVGDWILPEIRMEPVNTITYGVYHSGLIDLALARGNRRLTQGTRDIGNNNLEMGFEIGPKCQKTTSNTNSNGWGSGFHNYTLIWTPDNLKFQVDDIPATALLPQGRKLYEAFGIEIDQGRKSNWQKGSNIAPFDKPFYLSIGLSAGGLKHFPDESRNGDGKKKPWNDFKVKALLTFWDNRNDWLESWEKNDGKDSSLQIDYVRITAI